MYEVRYSSKRIGWCIFKLIDDLSVSFHAGPFDSQAIAESEAKRLTDLTPNAAVKPRRHGD